MDLLNLSPEGKANQIIDDILNRHNELYCITNGLEGSVFVGLVAPYLKHVLGLYHQIEHHKHIGLVNASLDYWSAMLESYLPPPKNMQESH